MDALSLTEYQGLGVDSLMDQPKTLIGLPTNGLSHPRLFGLSSCGYSGPLDYHWSSCGFSGIPYMLCILLPPIYTLYFTWSSSAICYLFRNIFLSDNPNFARDLLVDLLLNIDFFCSSTTLGCSSFFDFVVL